MRRRIIKPEFWSSMKIAKLSRDARLFFIAIWNCSDDYGVILDNDRRLFGEIFPYDDDVTVGDVRKWKDELIKNGFLRAFRFKEKKFLWVDRWKEHQTVDRPSPQKWTTEKPEAFFDLTFQRSDRFNSEHVPTSSRDVRESLAIEEEEEEKEEEKEEVKKKEKKERGAKAKASASPKQKKPIEERVEQFRKNLLEFRGTYPDPMLKKFFGYWSQKTGNEKELLFEREKRKKAFELPLRLSNWKARDYDDKRPNQSKPGSNMARNLARLDKMRVEE